MKLPDYVKISVDETHREILGYAYRFAFTNSEDDSTKTAAFLINKKGGLFGMNANHYPKCVKQFSGYDKAPEKYVCIIHGEDGAIKRAHYEGLSTKGSMMIAPWYACSNCADTIIYSGVKKIVGHKSFFDKTPKDWEHEVNVGLEKLHNSGIELIVYEGKIGGVQGFLRGKKWRP